MAIPMTIKTRAKTRAASTVKLASSRRSFFRKAPAIVPQEAEREGMEAFSAGHRRLR